MSSVPGKCLSVKSQRKLSSSLSFSTCKSLFITFTASFTEIYPYSISKQKAVSIAMNFLLFHTKFVLEDSCCAFLYLTYFQTQIFLNGSLSHFFSCYKFSATVFPECKLLCLVNCNWGTRWGKISGITAVECAVEEPSCVWLKSKFQHSLRANWRRVKSGLVKLNINILLGEVFLLHLWFNFLCLPGTKLCYWIIAVLLKKQVNI